MRKIVVSIPVTPKKNPSDLPGGTIYQDTDGDIMLVCEPGGSALHRTYVRLYAEFNNQVDGRHFDETDLTDVVEVLGTLDTAIV